MSVTPDMVHNPSDTNLDRLFAFYDGLAAYSHRAPVICRLIEQIRLLRSMAAVSPLCETDFDIDRNVARLIDRAYFEFSGNRQSMAKALGIPVRTLCDRMKRLGYAPRSKPVVILGDSSNASQIMGKESDYVGTQSPSGRENFDRGQDHGNGGTDRTEFGSTRD